MPQVNYVRLSEFAYQAAILAMKKRDYVTALEKLQIARMQDPDDARPLNALGVAYDKLGMFDVSGRFYGEALAIEPGSVTVLHNLAYSLELQRQAAIWRRAPMPAAAEAVSAPAGSVAVEAPVPETNVALSTDAAPALPPKPSRERLMIMDGSGSGRVGDSIRRLLLSKRWVAGKRNLKSGPRLDESIIRFEPRQEKLAIALSLTLPVRLPLVPDEFVEGVVLNLGEDSLDWRIRDARTFIAGNPDAGCKDRSDNCARLGLYP